MQDIKALRVENQQMRVTYKKLWNALRISTVKNIQLQNRITALEEENSIYILGSLCFDGKAIRKK